MFCSNCGKSLKPDAANCPHCGAVVGDSRFDGHPYTGAQIRIRPGEAVRLPGNHTRTTYMGSEPADDGDVETRTTYRATNEGAAPLYTEPVQEPLYNAEDDGYDTPEEAEPAPEEAASEPQPEEEPEDFDEDDEAEEERLRAERKAARKARRAEKRAKREAELDAEDRAEFGDDDGEDELSELKARSIEIEKRAGISEDVSRYMTELRSAYEEKTRAQEEKPKKKAPLFSFRKPKKDVPSPEAEETDEPEEEFSLEESFEDEAASQAEEYDPNEEAQYIADDGDLDFVSENADAVVNDFDEFTNENLADDIAFERRQKVFRVLKYVIAAGIVVAVIVGITVLLSNIAHDTQRAQVPNVTPELYEQGVEIMQYRVGDDYIKSMLSIYNANNSSTLVAFSEAMSKDLDSLSGLLPAQPDLNDQRFINALTAIQEDINNCLTNDVLSLSDASKTNDVKQAESDARWTIVRDKVSVLATATDKAKLDAIIKGERIEVIQQATAEPEPTATPTPYATLSKGSKGASVIELQTRLTELGYMDSEIDGDFGNKTKTAVQLFQKAAGMETSGIADVETQLALFAEDAPKYEK